MAAVGTAQAMDIEPQFRAPQYHAPRQDPTNVVNPADARMDQIGSPDRMPRLAPSRTASPPRRDTNSLLSRRNRGELSPLTTFQSLSTSAQASSASATPLESLARGVFAPADGGRSSRSPSPRLLQPSTGNASSTSSPDHPATGLYLGPATRNSPRALTGGGIPSAQRAGSPAGVNVGAVAGAGLPVNPFNLAHGGCPRSPMRSRQQLSAHGGSQRAIAPSPLSELLSAGGSNRMDIQPGSLEADSLQIQIPKDHRHLSQQQFPSNGRSQHGQQREEHSQERDSCLEQQTQQQSEQQARQLYSQQSVPSAVPSAMLSAVPSAVPSHRSPRSSSLDSYDHVIASHSPHGDYGGMSHVPFAHRPQLPSPKQLHAPLNPHASQSPPPPNGAPGHNSPSRGGAGLPNACAPVATPRPARPSHRRTASASAASALADMLEGSSSPSPAFFSRPPPSPRLTHAQPIAPSAAAALVAVASAGSGPATPRGASPRRSPSPGGARALNSASRAVQDLHARLLAAAQMVADGDAAGAAATAEAAAAVAAAMQQQQQQQQLQQQQQQQQQQQGGGKRQGRAIGISELQMELGGAQGHSAAGGNSRLRGISPLQQAGGPAAPDAGLAGAVGDADRLGGGANGAGMRTGGAGAGGVSPTFERAEQLKRRGSAMLGEEDMRALSHMSLGGPSAGVVGSGGISGTRSGAGDCAGYGGARNGGASNGDAGVCNRPVKQRVSTGHRSASSGVGAGIGGNNGGGSGGGSSGGSGDYASALSAAASAALAAAGAPAGIFPGEITQIAQKWMELQGAGGLGGYMHNAPSPSAASAAAAAAAAAAASARASASAAAAADVAAAARAQKAAAEAVAAAAAGGGGGASLGGASPVSAVAARAAANRRAARHRRTGSADFVLNNPGEALKPAGPLRQTLKRASASGSVSGSGGGGAGVGGGAGGGGYQLDRVSAPCLAKLLNQPASGPFVGCAVAWGAGAGGRRGGAGAGGGGEGGGIGGGVGVVGRHRPSSSISGFAGDRLVMSAALAEASKHLALASAAAAAAPHTAAVPNAAAVSKALFQQQQQQQQQQLMQLLQQQQKQQQQQQQQQGVAERMELNESRAEAHMAQSGQKQQQASLQHQVVPQVFSQVVAPHRQQQGRQLNATLGAAVRKPASFSGNVEDVFGQYEGLPPRDHVLRKEYGEIKGLFVLHSKELGSGQFGIIRPCMEVATGQVFACKTINKKCIQTKEDAEDIRKEVACLTLLRGHPTIVALRDTVEDEENIHIVMELCQGGDLFDRVSSSGRLTEQCAARLCRALVEALLHCHCHGILHRDIKPENILLCDRSENSRIKLVDFGVATFFEPGKRLTEVLGTPEYMAPEVLLQSYGPEADIWSAGVVLYILLCGVPPFWASSRKCVAEAILKGSVSFKSAKWANASEECKELVRRMLTKDPRERITALEILDHPWIRRYQ
ncbi:unnamed protein product [Closterium sp. Yama58-4]|nr:unnamed protein product [Closterium sp. Yama58-4]